ncbi:hypothetical protein NR798_43810 [Archangium gephyra]|uniref:hypothetical protein n=1 Tax=Archangium gephyra TaxID=48 RepID=UPI0035D4188F
MKPRLRLHVSLLWCLGGLLLGSTAVAQQDPRVVVVHPTTGVKAGGKRPAFAPSQPKRYWADYAGNAIRRSNLDGSNVETVAADTSTPYGTSYDPETGHILWTSSGDELVQMAPASGSATATTLNSSFEEYFAVTVKGTESNVAYGVVNGQILKVTEDRNTGTERRDVLYTLSSADDVHGLALTPDNTALYLGDLQGRMTRKLNLQTLQVQPLVYDSTDPCSMCVMSSKLAESTSTERTARPRPATKEKAR